MRLSRMLRKLNPQQLGESIMSGPGGRSEQNRLPSGMKSFKDLKKHYELAPLFFIMGGFLVVLPVWLCRCVSGPSTRLAAPARCKNSFGTSV